MKIELMSVNGKAAAAATADISVEQLKRDIHIGKQNVSGRWFAADEQIQRLIVGEACYQWQDPDSIRFAVDHGFNVNSPLDEDGKTILHHITSINKKSISLLQFLLQHQADVNIRNRFCQTPLHFWVLQQLETDEIQQILRLFRQYNADFNAKDILGNTPLHYVCYRRSQYQDCSWMIRILAEAGANINAVNDNEETPLFSTLSCQYFRLPILQCLIQHGADVDIQDINGFTAAHTFAMQGTSSLPELQLLIEHMKFNSKSRFSGLTVPEIVGYFCPDSDLNPLFQQLLCNFNKKLVRQNKAHCLPDIHGELTLDTIQLWSHWNQGTYWYLTNNCKPVFVAAKRMAKEFLRELERWDGNSDSLRQIISCYCLGNYHMDVDCTEEKCHILQGISDTLQIMINQDGKYDIIATGAAADGSQLFLPDQFEFLVVAKDNTIHEDPTFNFEYFLTKSMRNNTDNILPDSRLNFLVKGCAPSPKNGSAILSFVWNGTTYPMLIITVQLYLVTRQKWTLNQLVPFHVLSRHFPFIDREESFQLSNGNITVPTLETQIFQSMDAIHQDLYRLMQLLFISPCLENQSSENDSSQFIRYYFLNYLKTNPFSGDVNQHWISLAIQMAETLLLDTKEVHHIAIEDRLVSLSPYWDEQSSLVIQRCIQLLKEPIGDHESVVQEDCACSPLCVLM